MSEAVIIMNPCAGTKKANKYLTDIIYLFSQYGYFSRVFMTSGKGDGTFLAKKYAKEADLLVAIGGDGTLNEVIEGIVKSKADVPLGYIPAGSTNDFATTLKLHKNILNAARDIMEGTPKTLDIGLFNDKCFTYVASFGAFTRISYSTPQNFKNTFGHLAYILEGIKDIPSIRHEHMRIETDRDIFEDDYLFGAVSNSTTLGGVLTIDPDTVDLNDGLLELILIRRPKNVFEMNQLILSLNGQIYDCEMINLVSTKTIKIHCNSHPDWTLDGEFQQGTDYIEIKNVPNAFRIITNS